MTLVRGQSGTSLIELLLAGTLLVLVLGSMLAVFDTTAQIAPRDGERAHAVREAQAGLANMTRELRQAYRVRATTPNSMDVVVRIAGQDRRVLYDCSTRVTPDDPDDPWDQTYRQCVRYEAAATDELPATGSVAIDRVLNGTPASPVFGYTYAPGALVPKYATARIEAPARGERKAGFAHKVVLSDGFFLRNVTVD